MAQVKAALERPKIVGSIVPPAKLYGSNKERANKKAEKRMSQYMMPGEVERAKFDHSAFQYFASIYAPWEIQGIRKPDLTMAPTGTVVDLMPGYMPGINGSTSDRVYAIRVCPWPNQGIQILSAAVASTNFTLGTVASSPNYTDLVTRFGAMRAISCGVRVLDYGRIADRGVLLYAVTVPLGYSLNSMSLTNIRALPEARAIPISDEGVAEVVWLPLDGGPYYDATTADNQPFFSQWCDPYAAIGAGGFARVERAILIVASSDDTTVSDDFAVEIIVNYETLPLVQYDRTVDRKVCLGGSDSIATAAASLESNTNTIGSVVTDGIRSVGETATKIMGWANKGVDVAHKIGGFMDSVLGGMEGTQFLTEGEGLDFASALFLTPKEHDVYMQCQSRHVNISAHHPFIKRLAMIDDPERIDVLVGKLRKLENPTYSKWTAKLIGTRAVSNHHEVEHDEFDQLLAPNEIRETQHPCMTLRTWVTV